MCGIFGIAGHSEAAKLTYSGLYALQHRGQESAGIVSSDGQRLYALLGRGLVREVFDENNILALPGSSSIGHVRYSTAGGNSENNIQPLVVYSRWGQIAASHNGQLVGYKKIREDLEQSGVIFQSTSDTEVILHLLARSQKADLDEALVDVLSRVQGAFSLLLQTPNAVYAARDPLGFRPLGYGRLDGAHVFGSETCAFDLLGADYSRDVFPGEILKVSNEGKLETFKLPHSKTFKQCIFEHVYFSRPDSTVFDRRVKRSRTLLGIQLWREAPVVADVVVPVPDSGNQAALGYSQESGIPFDFGFIRNHYVGRTFIEPQQAIRDFGVKVKLNPVREVLENKRVVLVDDSIVRATTSKKIVAMGRAAGAKEIHVRITSPPIVGPCLYGIDTPTKAGLIAANKSVEEIRKFIDADSLGYLSFRGMRAAVEGDITEQGLLRAADVDNSVFCDACFTEEYPIPPEYKALDFPV